MGRSNSSSSSQGNAALVAAELHRAGPTTAGSVGSNRPDDDGMPGDTYLRVGDLARCTGKTVRAIHHYEELGLLGPALRSKGHYRLFSPDAEVRVRWIGKLQKLGLSLTEIQSLVHQRHASPNAALAAEELKAVYKEKLSEVRAEIASLSALERELGASLSYLEECHTSCDEDEGISACASCERHPEPLPAPDLIAGANIQLGRQRVLTLPAAPDGSRLVELGRLSRGKAAGREVETNKLQGGP